MASSLRSGRLLRRLSAAVAARAAIACVATACSHSPTGTTAAPSAHAYAESLVISLDEARRIANFEGLQPYSYADRDDPPRQAVGDPPGPCRAVGATALTFAGGWKEYRSVGYSGSTDDLRPGGIAPINEVTNAVVIYPDAAAARGPSTSCTPPWTSASPLHHTAYDFALNRPDTRRSGSSPTDGSTRTRSDRRCWCPSACSASNRPSRSPTTSCRR